MATQIVRFEPSLLPAVRRFAEQVWERPRSEAFYRWRYLESPLLRGYLALRDDEVVATLWAIRRPWRVGTATVHIQEVFDWFTLPSLRGSGGGARALQEAMKQDEPCVLVGGSEDSQVLMPRLGFSRAADAERYVLPLRRERLAPLLARRTRAPVALMQPAAAALVRTRFRPRVRSRPGCRMIVAGAAGPEALRLLDDADAWPTRPLWPDEHLRWLTAGFAGTGLTLPLYFVENDDLRGFALLRIHPAEGGRDAQLVELAAREPDVALHEWMVSETARVAAGMGAGLMAALSTCPITIGALRAARFLPLGSAPVHFYSKSGMDLPGPLHVGHNTGDDALIPCVERWWE